MEQERKFRFIRCILLFLLIVSLTSCGIIPEKVDVNDPILIPYWKAANKFDRMEYGFSPLPDTGVIRFEKNFWEDREYDFMIHINNETSRTIAFKKNNDSLYWISEQEIFQGPNQYKSVDGEFYEHICLTFDSCMDSDELSIQYRISYWGEDERFFPFDTLTLDDITPIKIEWGY